MHGHSQAISVISLRMKALKRVDALYESQLCSSNEGELRALAGGAAALICEQKLVHQKANGQR